MPGIKYVGTIGIDPSILLPRGACAGILVIKMSVSNRHFDRQANSNQSNRRRSERMEIEQEVHYRVLNKKDGDISAQGKTVNISSSGVLFTTQQTLPPGRQVELDITWPAQLDNKCNLKLVARGRVVRLEGDRAALEILQHEFRTKGTRR